MLFRGLRNKEW